MGYYEFANDQCDVENQELLERFRQSKEQWLHQMRGDVVHSVSRQITTMLFDDLCYRVAFQIRKYSVEHRKQSSLNNELIARILDHGWVLMQAFHIRKLFEDAAAIPKRQVISLRRLCKEIADNRDLYTRENFVCDDGLPYNYQPIKNNFIDKKFKDSKSEGIVYEVPIKGPEGWGASERRHIKFDKLSGTSKNNRKRTDRILNQLFDRMINLSDSSQFDDILDVANKFLGHAADEFSRKEGKALQPGFSLDRISEIHRQTVGLANFVSATLLMDASSAFLPTPQYNPFELLDSPAIGATDAGRIHDFWKSRAKEVRTWANYKIDDFL